MIPEQHDVPAFSEFALRQISEAEGVPVTHAQWQRYRLAGIVPEPDADGRWDASVTERIRLARELAPETKSLSRRVVRLYDREAYPVQVDKLRRAIVEVTEAMKRPVQTVALVVRAGRSPAVAFLRPPEIAQAKNWPRLLAAPDDSLFADLVVGCSAMARYILPLYANDPKKAIRRLPLEELIVAYLVIDLSQRYPAGGTDIDKEHSRLLSQPGGVAHGGKSAC